MGPRRIDYHDEITRTRNASSIHSKPNVDDLKAAKINEAPAVLVIGKNVLCPNTKLAREPSLILVRKFCLYRKA